MPIRQAILEQLNTSEDVLFKQLDNDVREIFTSMVGMELSPVSRQIDAVSVFRDSVTAMVGLAGVYNGLISINTPSGVAKTITSNMLGMEVSEIDDEVIDALGEIANMIGGSFKHHFVKDGHEVRLSTPSVITGEEYAVSVGSMPDSLTISYESGEEQFTVSVCLESGDQMP
jgi:chemotaxis protein CheX